MVLVPAVKPVTTPVEETTVATAVFELVHVPPVVVADKVVVLPLHTQTVPVMNDTVGEVVNVNPCVLVPTQPFTVTE